MEAADQVLTERLRERGQRVTLPRLMVHRFVASERRHLTADDVHAQLPTLSPATVYSTLELLEDLGLVRRVSTLEGAAVYDSHAEPHGHAVCRVCGAIFDVDSHDVPRTAAPKGFEVEQAEIQLVGRCANCA